MAQRLLFFFAVALPDDFFVVREELFLLAEALLLLPRFFGILAPASRASLKAIAIACLGFFTLPPLPDFKVPCLYSCMTFCTFPRPFVDELLRLDEDLVADFFVAIAPPRQLRRL
jgi:hypothetical protein